MNEITIILSIRHSKGFSQICSSGFTLYSERLGTAAPFLKYVPPGFAVYRVIRYRGAFSLVCSPDFSQYSVRLGTAEPFFKFVLLVFRNLPCV